MGIRIALTMAGGVSLGAYQGGVAYELLWALAHRTTKTEPVLIDVITGSSAGSMTGAMMARALLLDQSLGRDLHRAWVTGISFDALIAGKPSASLLSDEAIWKLARQLLEPVPAVDNAHPAAPDHLRLTLTLSNLNGVNFAQGYANAPGAFDTTVFSDWIIFRLGRSVPASRDAEQWKRIARAAIASGAFPFAFPTVSVVRDLADYRNSEIYAPQGTRPFTYVDGGLFNNEPVGLARDMVEEIERVDPRVFSDERLYILVDPYVAGSAAVVKFPSDPLAPQAVMGRLITVILGESSKRDWIQAGKVNTRLEWQDALLAKLAEVIAAIPPAGAPSLAGEAAKLAGDIAEEKLRHSSAGAAPSPEDTRKYLEQNLIRLGPSLGTGPASHLVSDSSRDLFLNLAFILENVAGLRKKTELKLHLIAPKPGSLAGDFLGNFGGFFNQDWREHDWRRGRVDARDTIRQLVQQYAQLDYEPDLPESYVLKHDFSKVDEGNLPPEVVPLIEGRIKESIAQALGSGGAGLLKRMLYGVVSWYIARRVTSRMRSGLAPTEPI